MSFFCFYNTSQKVKFSHNGTIELWLRTHQQQAKLLGLLALIISFISLIWMDGTTMGIIHSFLMLMVAGSYIIALAPFKIMRLKHITILIVIAFLFEYLIF